MKEGSIPVFEIEKVPIGSLKWWDVFFHTVEFLLFSELLLLSERVGGGINCLLQGPCCFLHSLKCQSMEL